MAPREAGNRKCHARAFSVSRLSVIRRAIKSIVRLTMRYVSQQQGYERLRLETFAEGTNKLTNGEGKASSTVTLYKKE